MILCLWLGAKSTTTSPFPLTAAVLNKPFVAHVSPTHPPLSQPEHNSGLERRREEGGGRACCKTTTTLSAMEDRYGLFDVAFILPLQSKKYIHEYIFDNIHLQQKWDNQGLSRMDFGKNRSQLKSPPLSPIAHAHADCAHHNEGGQSLGHDSKSEI